LKQMEDTQHTVRAAVKRARAETYLLISLTAFAGSVIGTRLFLELAGYPQLGNSVLHIAHALWGGLLLMVAARRPLAVGRDRSARKYQCRLARRNDPFVGRSSAWLAAGWRAGTLTEVFAIFQSLTPLQKPSFSDTIRASTPL